ncbi:MAG: type II secretion system F family protein [Nitrososphaerota archaeon]|nr:type II secretion system F family protein [Candidatus Bathyarchaeota archaeon]MDW8049152.1 type II secretion system F family protein [Nitrososphaerota archaeon]
MNGKGRMRTAWILTHFASLVVAFLLLFYGYSLHGLSYSFRPYVGLALVSGLTAPSTFIYLEERRRRLIDDALPRLLEGISESYEAGLTLLQAIEESSRRKYGPITKELKKLARDLAWGANTEAAFKAFSERVGTELSTRVTTLIVEAMKFGGDIKSVFRSTSEFARKMVALRDERESQLRLYLAVVYISIIVFIIIMIILYQSFFLPISIEPTQFLRLPMTIEDYKALIFDISIIEALFGGLIAGKLSHGLVLSGLKHSLILTAIATVSFWLVF